MSYIGLFDKNRELYNGDLKYGIPNMDFMSEVEIKQEALELIDAGFLASKIIPGKNGNETQYFTKEGFNKVIIHSYITGLKPANCKNGNYSQETVDLHYSMVISKNTYEVIKNIGVFLVGGSSSGHRCIPKVILQGKHTPIHSIGNDSQYQTIDHIYHSINIADDECLRLASRSNNNKNKCNIGRVLNLGGKFYGKFSWGMTEGFENVIDLLHEMRRQEVEAFGCYAYAPLKNYNGVVKSYIDYTILKKVSEKDFIRQILIKYIDDPVFIARYCLEEEYKKYGMNYPIIDNEMFYERYREEIEGNKDKIVA